jgi:glucose-1-phosphate adenylyltransferase
MSTTSGRILEFLEKPADPPGMPGNPTVALASMGIYVFETEFLLDLLRATPPTPTASMISARTSSRAS